MTMKLTIENDIKNLDKVAHLIEEFSEANELSPKISFEINLVLDELITNTISYGYDDESEHVINITIEKSDNLVKIEIIDDGKEFNPLVAKEADINLPLADKQIGGLGIHLIKQKVDEISYKRENGINIISMKKKV